MSSTRAALDRAYIITVAAARVPKRRARRGRGADAVARHWRDAAPHAAARAPSDAAADGGAGPAPDGRRRCRRRRRRRRVPENSASADLTVLIAALVVVMIVACAAVALAGYTVWKHHKARRDEPTWRDIQELRGEPETPSPRRGESEGRSWKLKATSRPSLGVRGKSWSPLTTEQSRGVELVDLKEDDLRPWTWTC